MTPEKLAIGGAAVFALLLGIAAQLGWLNGPAGAITGSVFGIEVPALEDSAMIRRGAAHYDRVCARCHASPDRPDAADALDLSPSPPKLHVRVEEWSPEALFTIVRNGVPRSGMPAWPAQRRDDEVWSMVAFLRVLPDLDAATYRSLAGLTAATTDLPPPLASCVKCHGTDGRGTPDGAVPRLDIQTPDYLYETLLAFRDGRRASGFMQSAVSGLRDEELRDLAIHFGKGAAAPATATSALPSAASRNDPLPACTACHGPPAVARAEFPSLAGQYENYLIAQLQLLADREKPRGGGPFIGLMHEAGHFLTDSEIANAATWYASQAPVSPHQRSAVQRR